MTPGDDAGGNWGAEELARFANDMRWVLERKDLDAFWPIGIPSAGRGGASFLVDVLDGEPPNLVPRNPTTAVLLYLYALHGMRERGWDHTRRLALARSILSTARAGKAGAVFDPHGTHRLVLPLADWVRGAGIDLLADRPHEARSSLAYLRRVNLVCATTWALAEAACFFNHRLMTERHGPYRTSRPDRVRLIRSAYGLDLTELWPELSGLPRLPISDFEAVVVLPASDERWFDPFANPIFTADLEVDVEVVSLAVRTVDGAVVAQPSLDLLDDVLAAMRRAIVLLLDQVSRMSLDARARKVFRIMTVTAARLGLCSAKIVPPRGWEYTDAPPLVRAGPPLGLSLNESVAYYDVRSDLTSDRSAPPAG